MPRQSLQAEIAAARALAATIGLSAVEPEVLKLAKHTTLKLAPHPIVARIQSAGSPQAQADMARELTIAGALGSLDAPTVRPAATVDAGPYFANGCVISLWDFAPGRAADEDADGTAVARSLRDLHQALEQVETELPSFTASVDTCETILSDHAEARNIPPDDRLFLTRRFSTLREQLGHRQLDCRPLHGDTHLANVLVTSSGPVWMDLEAVCTGPLEWDLVALPPSVRSEFSGSDPDLLRLLAELRSVCVATWCWADFERSAETAEAAIYHLDRLKARLGSSG